MVARALRHGLFALFLLLGAQSAAAQTLTLGTTTSIDNSGLLEALLPAFRAETGIAVRPVVRATGAILALGRSGDIDVLFTHDPAGEAAFVADGNGIARHDVMTSRFLIVGPAGDPANVAGAPDAGAALRRIAAAKASFVSRGDDSGTHLAERSLWARAGVVPAGDWYRETGAGMGATLRTAIELDAYVLTESATWAAYTTRGNHRPFRDAGPNPYGVIPVDPSRQPHVNKEAAARFVDWITGRAGQEIIAGFEVGGAHPFLPAAEQTADR